MFPQSIALTQTQMISPKLDISDEKKQSFLILSHFPLPVLDNIFFLMYNPFCLGNSVKKVLEMKVLLCFTFFGWI